MTDGPGAGTLPSRDVAAIDALVASFAEPVYRVAHGLTGSATEAEEILRDVFRQAARDVDPHAGPALVRTWMYRMTTRAARHRRKGSATGPSILAGLPQFTDDGHRAGERAYLLADWSGLAEETLRVPLQILADEDRAALVLIDGERLSAEEAADVLEEPPPTLRSRLHRARMLLREQITRAHAPGVGGVGSPHAELEHVAVRIPGQHGVPDAEG
jgi:RNA polymerase sigma-70 factor (ECF subfamily)